MKVDLKRRRNLILLAFVLAFALAGYAILRRDDIRFWRKFAVVKEGILLRSRIPTVSELQKIERRYGVRSIAALLNDEEVKNPIFIAEQEYARQHGIELIYLRAGVPTPEQVATFLEAVDNPSKQPVLVHCWHGTVRTGVLVAIYRVKKQGWTLEKALDEMAAYGFDLKAPLYKPMLDTIRAQTGKKN